MTGLSEAAELPKENSMKQMHYGRALLMVSSLLLCGLLVSACEALPPNALAAAPPTELGACAPDETASACETSCSRLSGCADAPFSEDAHWSCTRRCAEQAMAGDSPTLRRVECLLEAGDACCEVDACALEPAETAKDVALLPYADGTTNYCEQAANEIVACDGFVTSTWSAQDFVAVCSTWGSTMQRKLARCTVKNHGACHRVLGCKGLPQAD